LAIENSIRRGTAAAAWLSFWSAITREERSKRLASNISLAAVFLANYGGMAFPASMPERIKGLFGGASTGRMPVQRNVWLLLPSVADYPALFECTKENCSFTVRV